MNKKILSTIQAFTIMEVTIAMIVAGIVVMMSYTVFTIMGKSYLDFSKKNEGIASLLLFDRLLKRDFSNARLIVLASDALLLKKDGSNIIYYFGDDEIIRRSAAVADTFKLAVVYKEFAFEGSPVESGTNLAYAMTANGSSPPIQKAIVDELNLRLQYQSQIFEYTYQKHYSSTNLIERKAYARN